MTDRVVLAYSGGLDTSVGIGWIAEATGAEVIAVAVDVGQGGEDLEVIRRRALDCGAVEAYVADARDEFATEYCMPGSRLMLEGVLRELDRLEGIVCFSMFALPEKREHRDVVFSGFEYAQAFGEIHRV